MRLKHMVCRLLHGHQFLPVREKDRLVLKCLCGAETPGWDLDPRSLSAKDIREIEDEMIAMELALLGGG